jgi:hypothetical protein
MGFYNLIGANKYTGIYAASAGVDMFAKTKLLYVLLTKKVYLMCKHIYV